MHPLCLQAHPAPNAERGTPQPLTLTIQFPGPKLRRPANRPLTPAAPFRVDWHTCTATRGRNTPPQAFEAPTPPRSISPRLRARCHSIGRYDALAAATYTDAPRQLLHPSAGAPICAHCCPSQGHRALIRWTPAPSHAIRPSSPNAPASPIRTTEPAWSGPGNPARQRGHLPS